MSDELAEVTLEVGEPMEDKIQGKIEDVKGKVTGDRVEEMKGKARQKVGGVKQVGKEIAYDAEHPNTEEELDETSERRPQER
jgi:uncharacterized protein YjbJ (UPF0337 family)